MREKEEREKERDADVNSGRVVCELQEKGRGGDIKWRNGN